ncbi:hypothetical protein GCM10010353_65350 [Streptomyces chryseus]|nr:hypothetical protein GCM10010353_65350 [Streptomyces chryseus]
MSTTTDHLIEATDGVSLAMDGASVEGADVKSMPVSENGLSAELLARRNPGGQAGSSSQPRTGDGNLRGQAGCSEAAYGRGLSWVGGPGAARTGLPYAVPAWTAPGWR